MIRWNTGRWYTEYGQRMAAAETAEGGILFVDVDRMIEGYITPAVRAGAMPMRPLRLTPEDVLWAYDHHEVSNYWVALHGQDRDQLQALREAAKELPALGKP